MQNATMGVERSESAQAPRAEPSFNDEVKLKTRNYITLLQAADWSHEFSDDAQQRKSGRAILKRLQELQPVVDVEFRLWNIFAPAACLNGASYS